MHRTSIIQLARRSSQASYRTLHTQQTSPPPPAPKRMPPSQLHIKPPLALLSARYWPQALPHYLHFFAGKLELPFHVKLARRIAARDPQTLWWQVRMQSPLVDRMKKKVVRGWCVKRVKRVLEQALAGRGWDREGRAMGAGEGEEEERTEGLVGTLIITLKHEVLTAPRAALELEALAVVKEVERRWGVKGIAPRRPRGLEFPPLLAGKKDSK